MVLKKCEKCVKGFRSSIQKETLCAKCTIENLPTLENVGLVEQEFNKIAEQIYGSCEREADLLNVNDIFNHASRLETLQKQCNSIKSTKDRQKRNREIHRIQEENEAIRDKVKSMSEMVMSAILLTNTTNFKEADSIDGRKLVLSPPKSLAPAITKKNNVPPAANSSEVFNVSLKKIAEENSANKSVSPKELVVPSPPIFKVPATPVSKQGAVVYNTPPSLSTKEDPHRVQSANKDKLMPLKSSISVCVQRPEKKLVLSDLVTPARPNDKDDDVMQEEQSDNEDELMPLKRSNSVRNKIQAFEALSRRASTGTYDRGVSPRRKLKF